MKMSAWFLLPVALLYVVFALLPIGVIFARGVADGGSHFVQVLHSPLLLRVIGNTIAISLLTTAVALVLGCLLAVALWRAGPRLRTVLLGFILLPFWTSVLVKNFAWAALLQDNGTINSLLQATGLTSHPVTLLHDRLAVIVGMVHYVLPYAVFPIATALRGIDPALERAARSLGARPRRVAWHVVLPLCLPGIAAAALLCFIISSGFFITPVILGAPSDMMIANLVDYYVHELVDFDGAAALAMLILAALVPVIVAQQRLSREGQHGPA